MKLKGLLKGLCILGLTLLPISFSNGAWNSVSCQEFTNSSTLMVYDNVVLTFPNGNFTTNRLNNSIEHVAWLTRNNYTAGRLSSFFSWYNGKPYLFAGYSSDNYQGTPTNVCVESLSGFDITSFGSNMNCISEDISNFLSVSNIQGGYICYPDSTNTYAYAPFTYCFYDSNNAYCFKLTSYKNSPDLQVLTLNNSLNLPGGITPSNFESYQWESSPFSSVVDNSPTVINPRDSAQNIYDSYRKMGYSDVLCYGGFSLDDKFGTGNSSLNGIKIGSGAFITDLYNSHPYDVFDGSQLSIVDWYNSWDFEYGFFVDQHDLNEFSYYDGLSRGFVGLFLARDYFFKGSNFDPSVLISFCNFSLANAPLIDKSQTPIDIVHDSINENELNQMIGNIGIIKPGTGSALDAVARFVSGYNEDDYFSMFLSGFDSIDSVEIPTTEYPGILPNYIIVGFLGIMLLYVLKH